MKLNRKIGLEDTKFHIIRKIDKLTFNNDVYSNIIIMREIRGPIGTILRNVRWQIIIKTEEQPF